MIRLFISVAVLLHINTWYLSAVETLLRHEDQVGVSSQQSVTSRLNQIMQNQIKKRIPPSQLTVVEVVKVLEGVVPKFRNLEYNPISGQVAGELDELMPFVSVSIPKQIGLYRLKRKQTKEGGKDLSMKEVVLAFKRVRLAREIESAIEDGNRFNALYSDLDKIKNDVATLQSSWSLTDHYLPRLKEKFKKQKNYLDMIQPFEDAIRENKHIQVQKVWMSQLIDKLKKKLKDDYGHSASDVLRNLYELAYKADQTSQKKARSRL